MMTVETQAAPPTTTVAPPAVSRNRARQREARPRRKSEASQLMTVFHGSRGGLRDSIRDRGLQPHGNVSVFVTTDRQRAAGYAVRACCLDLEERAVADRPNLADAGLIVTVRVDRCFLVADPAHDGDYVLRDGCPPTAIIGLRLFDAAPLIPDAAAVAAYAGRARLARDLEPVRTWVHGTPAAPRAGGWGAVEARHDQLAPISVRISPSEVGERWRGSVALGVVSCWRRRRSPSIARSVTGSRVGARGATALRAGRTTRRIVSG